MNIVNEFSFNRDAYEVGIDHIQIRYIQELDCTQSDSDFNDDLQYLTLESADGGGGKFIRLKTGEAGWSIDSIDDLVKVIEHFKNTYEKM